MSPKLAKILKRLGYKFQGIESVGARRVVITAIKIDGARVFVAGHSGVSEADAEDKLGKMLERP